MSEKPAKPTDPFIIRSFIMYEALHKVPVFEAYKKLCKVVGDDVVDYVDYEYWYYRFYHGSLDMNYDRSADPKALTFHDLNDDMVKAIVNLLDVKSRLRSQKVCRKLNDTGRQAPKEFDEVAVRIGIENSLLEIDDGCTEKCYIRSRYMTSLVENLRGALEGPKIEIQKFVLSVPPKTDGCEEVIETLQKVRDESKGGIVVESSIAIVQDMESALSLLTLFKSGKLKNIKLSARDGPEAMNISELQAIDQFKMANRMDIRQFAVIDACLIFNHFRHLEYFQICVHSMSVEQIVDLRDMIILGKGCAERKGCIIEMRAPLVSKFDDIQKVLDGARRVEARRRQPCILYKHKISSNFSDDIFEFEMGNYCITVTRDYNREEPQKSRKF